MERDTTINTISIRQLGTLLVLALLPLGTEVLPSRLSQAGGAAWLCPLGAGGLLLALVALWRGRIFMFAIRLRAELQIYAFCIRGEPHRIP